MTVKAPATETKPADFMDELKYYTEERDKLLKFTLYSSGLSLLLAAASRIPTWEVSSGVAWVVGTVNVGFLPIFAPIFIFGAFIHALQRRAIVADLRRTLLADERFSTAFAQAALDNADTRGKRAGLRRKVLRHAFDYWLVLVPMIAYVILLCSYFDFTRPTKIGGHEYRYTSRLAQIGDLLIGFGGLSGFPPLAPSIHDNLERMASEQTDPKEAARLQRLAKQIPWIYPPFQTWAYLAGLIVMLWAAAGVRRQGGI
jgi:hypothetical protein